MEWQSLNPDPQITVWGGEPAADILTNHIMPEKYIMYTTESRAELMRKYSLISNQNGELEVLEMFWNPKHDITAPSPTSRNGYFEAYCMERPTRRKRGCSLRYSDNYSALF